MIELSSQDTKRAELERGKKNRYRLLFGQGTKIDCLGRLIDSLIKSKRENRCEKIDKSITKNRFFWKITLPRINESTRSWLASTAHSKIIDSKILQKAVFSIGNSTPIGAVQYRYRYRYYRYFKVPILWKTPEKSTMSINSIKITVDSE